MPKQKQKKSAATKKVATPTTKMQRFAAWIDAHILLLLSGFLLVFIPLYPKLPLFEAIPGYIVRVRLEDVAILLTAVVWCVQVLRKKITIKTPLTTIIAAYVLVGFFSSLSAIFITHTVPFQPVHVGKTFLHFFRYIEYFSLFFIIFSAIKTKKDAVLLLKVVFVTLLGVILYGIGQKYLYWPVYSTMNREFSKGVRLYLTEGGRVQSTFGGHYDLAGYLVVLLPFVFSFALLAKKKMQRYTLWLLFVLGLWMLIVAASRSSFISFLLAAVVMIFLLALKQSSLKQKLRYFFTKSLLLGVLVYVLVAFFGTTMYTRLLQTLEGYPTAYQNYMVIETQRIALVTAIDDVVPPREEWFEKPENSLSTDELDTALTQSDTQPTKERPSDVKVDIPVKVRVSTTSADGKKTTVVIEKERTYSENALKYGLSAAIRYDTLWPRAIAGFESNPLLGSGYATLTKDTTYHFTEAESTDNNFLRTLGETGLLGFLTFYGATVIAMWLALYAYRTTSNRFVRGVSVAYLAAALGLLINASYIDVFAASKVAFTFWGMTAVVLAVVMQERRSDTPQPMQTE
ncbi:MAG: O-antigen ligase family protein [Pseudomonadales bacterium]|nr:O-antigen ligase family protein [Candidatus Woesebacteria bacterium]MCB9802166.1 O-antigen ligase family protein [Pseudomonadales bacterium]